MRDEGISYLGTAGPPRYLGGWDVPELGRERLNYPDKVRPLIRARARLAAVGEDRHRVSGAKVRVSPHSFRGAKSPYLGI